MLIGSKSACTTQCDFESSEDSNKFRQPTGGNTSKSSSPHPPKLLPAGRKPLEIENFRTTQVLHQSCFHYHTIRPKYSDTCLSYTTKIERIPTTPSITAPLPTNNPPPPPWYQWERSDLAMVVGLVAPHAVLVPQQAPEALPTAALGCFHRPRHWWGEHSHDEFQGVNAWKPQKPVRWKWSMEIDSFNFYDFVAEHLDFLPKNASIFTSTIVSVCV